MNINLTQEEIKELRGLRNGLKSAFGTRNTYFDRYEEIFFMKGTEKPKSAGVDDKDWKVTVSPGGRDRVTGLKRILDTSEIHIKVKDKKAKDGKHINSDSIEAGLKEMLRISGEYKQARIERDTNLSAILYGPVVLSVDRVDDLIAARSKYEGTNAAARFVMKQLELIGQRTPFLIDTINARESYPEWGRYGLVGHLQEYLLRGSEIKERWPCDPSQYKDNTEYWITDYFHYDMRLVEQGSNTLFADRWIQPGEAVTNIPIFVRYSGGSTLFSKPEDQLNSFLYAYMKGEWDKRENLFWTYVFTAIYQQGLPGPTILRDPDDTSDITVDYRGGVKIITARGKLEKTQVIDGDVLQLKALMEDQTGRSTIQEQTIGGAAEATTFSAYVMSMNAGKLPAIDPTEAQEQCYKDLFTHILQRIKAEGIENDLIKPEDIPDDVELDVTMEPDLQQDDLRNSQIVAQLKNSGANVSNAWLNTNLLKIPDSDAMFREKTKEDLRAAVVAAIIQDPNTMKELIAAAMGTPPQPPQQPPTQPSAGGPVPPEMQQGMVDPNQMMAEGIPPEMMAEAMPMTDAQPMPGERNPNNGQRPGY